MNRRNFLELTGKATIASVVATTLPMPLFAQTAPAPKKQSITTQGNPARLMQEGIIGYATHAANPSEVVEISHGRGRCTGMRFKADMNPIYVMQNRDGEK